MYATYRNTKKFSGLDGLRFLSISAVVWHHSVESLSNIQMTRYGFLGVDLFFVISGFLILNLLLRERADTGNISLSSFYVRRSLRIFPLYYGFILGLAGLYFFFSPQSEFGVQFIRELPIYLFYLANFVPVALSVTWSLAMEEQFYLFWPCIEKYMKKYVLIILALALLLNQILNFYHASIANWLGIQDLNFFQSTFTPILLGVGLAHLLHNKLSFEFAQRVLATRYSAAFWLMALILSSFVWPEDISGWPRLAIQTNMMLLVGAVVCNEQSTIVSMLRFPPFVRLGVISYGIYLFHTHGIIVAESLLSAISLEHKLLTFVAGYAVTVIAAEISFRFYEAPFLRLKSRFSVSQRTHSTPQLRSDVRPTI